MLLANAGHSVVVYERAATLGAVGAGFMIQPTGQAVLAQLGVLEIVLDCGAHLAGLQCHTHSGRALLDLAYADVDSEFFGIGVQRSVLLAALCEAMSTAGVVLRLDRQLADIRDRCLVFADGSEEGPFDLIIGADGSRSTVRECLPLASRARAYPWGALWHMAQDESPKEYLDQVVRGAEHMVGLLPSGREDSEATSKTSMFWSVRVCDYEAWQQRGIDAWKRDVQELMPRAAPLLEGIAACSELTMARYWDVRMPKWSHDAAVIIGDAAHATSPQLGQGVNLGLWDARVLAACFDAANTVEAALHAYEAERRAPLSYYQWATRFLTPFFQSRSWSLGALRDAAMPVANWFGPSRRQMIWTMSGVKRGFVRRSLPLPSRARLSAASPPSLPEP